MDKSQITTAVTAGISAIVVPWLLSKGITLDPTSQAALGALVVAGVVGLAHFTHDKVVSATNPTLPPPASKASGFVRWELAASLALIAMIAVGCTALGITKPLTFNEQLSAGYTSVQGIATTADSLLKAGKITAKDAANVETQDTNLREALDIAAQVEQTDATSGGNKLTAAIAGINSLVTYLGTYK